MKRKAKAQPRRPSKYPSDQKSKAASRFSQSTLEFIKKASRQKNPDWLDRNREEYEEVLLNPLKHLALTLRAQVGALRGASGYHFPVQGIGRLKRSAIRAQDSGSLYKDWVPYTAKRPSESRFEQNPSLFFMLNPFDEDGDSVLVAGGLYMPSARQIRAIREAIALDASAFDELFRDRVFKKHFPGGFSLERQMKRLPRGVVADHPRMEWLKLQGFYVWKSYSLRDFSSAEFAEKVCGDWAQALRLNELLDLAVAGRWGRLSSGAGAHQRAEGSKASPVKNEKKERPGKSNEPGDDAVWGDEVRAPEREMDF
jgi:uncharacterized protein (TIGR02453 family)